MNEKVKINFRKNEKKNQQQQHSGGSRNILGGTERL